MNAQAALASPPSGAGLSPSVEPASGLAGFAASIPDAITALFQRHGILRISDLGNGFTVALRGNVLGTGRSVEEALANGLNERAILESDHG